MKSIRFSYPAVLGNELGLIKDALRQGHLSGNGKYTNFCQNHLIQYIGSTKALLTQSGTSALEMACLLCNLYPGDEVIMPSYTFSSTANAVALRGAIPVFVDIRQDTLNIDEKKIEMAITSRTRAILVVH